MRPSGRAANQLRDIQFLRSFTRHAEGSVLVQYGDTKVICNASVDEKVPPFLRGTGKGWVTAEYGMLPRATAERMRRESVGGRPSGRTQEIQRLIGRSLRAVVDQSALGERTVVIDCDVIQADGGTRTASITGGYIALVDAVNYLLEHRSISKNPIHGMLASVSVGIYRGQPVLDLDYQEDSEAETDMNVVMNDAEAFVEIQGTAEGHAFRMDELQQMLELAREGVNRLLEIQKRALQDG